MEEMEERRRDEIDASNRAATVETARVLEAAQIDPELVAQNEHELREWQERQTLERPARIEALLQRIADALERR